MLAAPNRLVSSAAFSTAVRGGRRAGSRTLVVHAALPAGVPPEQTRVGFVVSRAVGNAVVRNRVKRRLRHLMRERLGSAPAGSLLVVRALPASAASTIDSLGRDLDHCLGSALR